MVNPKNFFLDKEKLRTIDTIRIIYLMVFMVCFALTEAGRYIYRPFIYANNINDFGIADSMGNSGGIIVQIFFGLMLVNPTKTKGLRLIGFFVIGYVLYEVAQLILPKGVFDWKDIYATLIGGLIALGLFLLLNKLVKGNKTIYKF
ncbi:hypothetical protein KDU71_18255 [Carboxylicivirga sediminis]|uniref:VanZ-like domain-containing protein n=1 Tax=Carboxylicivirga sediminis TaxID=2006564 RepID=A0A941F845_9BACT|nr:hypothetical protein [Carboxylicivirga sediminis]MBR8537518.1 hypothetical protein [Carboxylicivirga sediminis]